MKQFFFFTVSYGGSISERKNCGDFLCRIHWNGGNSCVTHRCGDTHAEHMYSVKATQPSASGNRCRCESGCTGCQNPFRFSYGGLPCVPAGMPCRSPGASPYFVGQIGVGQHLACILGEQAKQLVFRGCQLQLLTAEKSAASAVVDGQFTITEYSFSCLCCGRCYSALGYPKPC